jgi:hypothetical protein
MLALVTLSTPTFSRENVYLIQRITETRLIAFKMYEICNTYYNNILKFRDLERTFCRMNVIYHEKNMIPKTVWNNLKQSFFFASLVPTSIL